MVFSNCSKLGTMAPCEEYSHDHIYCVLPPFVLVSTRSTQRGRLFFSRCEIAVLALGNLRNIASIAVVEIVHKEPQLEVLRLRTVLVLI